MAEALRAELDAEVVRTREQMDALRAREYAEIVSAREEAETLGATVEAGLLRAREEALAVVRAEWKAEGGSARDKILKIKVLYLNGRNSDSVNVDDSVFTGAARATYEKLVAGDQDHWDFWAMGETHQWSLEMNARTEILETLTRIEDRCILERGAIDFEQIIGPREALSRRARRLVTWPDGESPLTETNLNKYRGFRKYMEDVERFKAAKHAVELQKKAFDRLKDRWYPTSALGMAKGSVEKETRKILGIFCFHFLRSMLFPGFFDSV